MRVDHSSCERHGSPAELTTSPPRPSRRAVCAAAMLGIALPFLLVGCSDGKTSETGRDGSPDPSVGSAFKLVAPVAAVEELKVPQSGWTDSAGGDGDSVGFVLVDLIFRDPRFSVVGRLPEGVTTKNMFLFRAGGPGQDALPCQMNPDTSLEGGFSYLCVDIEVKNDNDETAQVDFGSHALAEYMPLSQVGFFIDGSGDLVEAAQRSVADFELTGYGSYLIPKGGITPAWVSAGTGYTVASASLTTQDRAVAAGGASRFQLYYAVSNELFARDDLSYLVGYSANQGRTYAFAVGSLQASTG